MICSAPTIAYGGVIFAGLIAMEMVPSMGECRAPSGNPPLLPPDESADPLLVPGVGAAADRAGLGRAGAAWRWCWRTRRGCSTASICWRAAEPAVRIEWRYARPDWRMMKRILRIALPGVVQRGIPNLANTILMRFMAGYGAAPLAAFSLFGRQTGLLLIPASGLVGAAPAWPRKPLRSAFLPLV